MRHWIGPVLLAAALAVFLAACEEEETYQYFDTSYIDTVLAADTIANGDTVEIEYFYPGGCNRFERFETSENGDTLEVSVILCFYFYGMPCAHGQGYTTEEYPLVFSSGGPWYLHYRRGKSEWVVQEVYVR